METNKSKGTIFKKLTPQSIKEIKERKQNDKERIEIEKTEAILEQLRLQQINEDRFRMNNRGKSSMVVDEKESLAKLEKQKKKQAKLQKELLKNIEIKREPPNKDFATGNKLPKSYHHGLNKDLIGKSTL